MPQVPTTDDVVLLCVVSIGIGILLVMDAHRIAATVAKSDISQTDCILTSGNCMGRRLCQNSNLGRRTKGIDIYRFDRYLSAVFLTDRCLVLFTGDRYLLN